MEVGYYEGFVSRILGSEGGLVFSFYDYEERKAWSLGSVEFFRPGSFGAICFE